MTSSRSNALVVAAFFLLLSLMLGVASFAIDQQERRVAQRQVEITASHVGLRLRDYVRARLMGVELLGRELQEGLITDRATFVGQARILQQQFGGYQAINWIDGQGTIRWVSPLEGNEGAIGRNVFDHPVAAEAAERAIGTRAPAMTGPIDLFQGGRGFATYFPQFEDASPLAGMLNGVFLIDNLVEQCLDETILESYELNVYDNEEQVYGEQAHPHDDRPQADALCGLLDRHWRICLTPRRAFWQELKPGNQRLLLIVGLPLAAVLAGLMWLLLRWRGQRLRAREERRLLEERLVQAQKMEAMGRLAGGIAHDFNNLLTAVLGHADIAMGASGTSLRHNLEQIVKGARRAGELTRQLLAFSRQQPRVPQAIDLCATVDDFGRLLQRLVSATVELAIETSEQPCRIVADATQMCQVVMNLTLNAVDALPAGGRVEIRVDPRCGTDGQDFVVLSVRDNGDGMSTDVQERILEPFFTTKEPGKGTGLGLAVVYGIVQQSGGQLKIDSTPGQGSTFEVWLPASDAPLSGEIDIVHAPEPPTLGAGTVLLVEDEAVVRGLVETALRRAGYQVLAAANGEEALVLFAEHKATIALLLSDVVMPGLGGIELARRLCAERPELSVILCSGYAPVEMAEFECGAVFIQKPYSMAKLLQAVREKLAQGRGHKPPDGAPTPGAGAVC